MSYDRIKALIQAAADSAGGVARLMLGTTGALLKWPDDASGIGRATGVAWEAVFLPGVLAHIGAELDRALLSWARISTEVTSVPSVISAASLITAVAKNEVSNVLTVTFAPGYSGVGAYAVSAAMVNVAAAPLITPQSASTCDISFYDAAGVVLDINNRSVLVSAVGTAG